MRICLGLLAVLPLAAIAETAYVTDNLRLGLHEAEDTSDRAFRFLDSGQPMEILSRDRNYANVRLPDGAQGWVKATYLVEDKPAKLIVQETLAERDALQAELDRVRAEFSGPAETIKALQNDAAALSDRLAASDARIADLKAENATIPQIKAQYKGSLPLRWVGIAIVVCLLTGFLTGLWWIDRSSRRRHGGIRIY